MILNKGVGAITFCMADPDLLNKDPPENAVMHNVSNHRNFYKNLLINEYARTNFAKSLESWSPKITEYRSFL